MALAIQQEEEAREWLSSCMRDKGWDIEVGPLLGIRFGGYNPQGPRDAMACWEALVPEDWGSVDVTRESVEAKFDRFLDVRDCLIHHGYEVSNPPSRDAWVDLYLSGELEQIWTPYAPGSRGMRQEEVCPANVWW
jgi:hypothetical protein